jgi:lipid-A-disaccharide synthase
MLEVSKSFPDYQFIVAKAASLEDDFYHAFLNSYPTVTTVTNQTYHLLSSSTAAMVTSGTATLETALFGVPQVVCYKGSSISYQIAKRLVKIKYISLVNLIMDKEVVKELIQDELTVDNLTNQERRLQIEEDYNSLKKLLQQNNASAKAAGIIVDFLKTTSLQKA